MRVTIIGLGLIGGSLGLALRRREIAKEIVGHDKNHSAARRARQIGAIDRAEWNLPASVEKSDLVVIAAPIGEIKDIFSQICSYLPSGCVVTDVASTKRQVIDWADESFPEGISFVGGHPMAGKEESGIEAATPDLFVSATYCIIPSRRAAPQAIDLLTSVVKEIGANPFFIDPVEHDSFVAAVSHLPFIAAAGLVNTVANSQSWRDLSRLAATGFRDTSRLASGNPVMHRDICRTNRDNILRWLDTYIAQLTEMRELIAIEDAALEEAFRRAKESRDAWLEHKGNEAAIDIPSGGRQIKQMFFGDLRRKEKK